MKGDRFLRRFPVGPVGLALTTRTWPFALAAIGAVVITLIAMLKAPDAVGDTKTTELFPVVVQAACAWGPCLFFVFTWGVGRLRLDASSGLYALFRARGHSAASYRLTRFLGLFGALFSLLAVPPLLVSVLLAGLAPDAFVALAHAVVACVVYAFFFSLVVASLAMAVAGSLRRTQGTLALFAVLILPSLVARLFPLRDSQAPIVSPLHALHSLRAAFLSFASEGSSEAIRAAAPLVAIAVVSFLWSRVAVSRERVGRTATS
jgi:hypothetical protein